MIKNITKVFFVLSVSTVLSVAATEDVVKELGKEAIQAVKEIALNQKSQIVLSGVTLDCKFDGEEFILIGNGCNKLSADNIKAFNTTMKADVKIKRGGVIGNIGNEVSDR